MSLLDDVSIVLTPNGYKAGELYGVIPVPTLGTEEITNGDFATDSDWTKGTGWTISGGSANCDGSQTGTSNLNNSVSNGLVNNVRYVVKYTISNYSAGSIRIKLGNTGYGDYNSANGTYTATLTALVSTFPYAQFNADSSFVGSIDNVSVKEYTSADMDVTRATAATRVDENGLVNYAEIIGSEEVTNGDFTTDTDWTKGTGWTISGGNLNASSPAGTVATSQSVAGLTAGKTYKVSFEVSEITSGYFRLYAYVGASGTFTNIFSSPELESGTYETTFEFGGTDKTFRIYGAPSSASALTVGSVSNISIKEETRDNVPRIDYTGGGCPHILAEPQRTNLVTYSEDFSQSYWTKQSGVTPTYNTTETLSPDGTYNATKFIGNGSSGVLKGGISVTGVIARSVYLKSITGTVNVVLKDPNLTVTQKTLTVTEEWQRFELIESNGTSTQGIWIDDIPVSGIYIWGAQLEEGSYATSYIPTSGSTVTRNQDIFTRDGIGSLINSTEGCVFGEGNFAESDSGSGYFYFVSLSDGTPNNRLEIRQSNTNLQFLWRVATYQDNIITSGVDVSSNFKFALSYSSANIKFYVNGNLIGTINTPTLWTANTLNRMAFDNGSGGDILSGKVKQLQVYNTALTDEQLLQLTGESGTDFYESYAEMASALTYTIQ